MTYNLGPLALIPVGEGRMFTAGDAAVAVFRTRDGRVYATEPWCPHRGGPLVDGLIATNRVLCPLHGYAFELATGCAIGHRCGSIETYPIRVTGDGHMLVTLRREQAFPSPPHAGERGLLSSTTGHSLAARSTPASARNSRSRDAGAA